MSDRIEGNFKGRGVIGSEQYGTTSNGNEQIAIDLYLSAIGQTLTTFLNFSDKAAPYAVERLRALGWEGDDLANLKGIDRNEVDVRVRYEMYQGKEQMRVEIMTGGGRVKLENQMDDKQKRAFAARMKSFLKSSGGAPAPKRQAPSAPVGGGGSELAEDEIPF